MSKKWQKELEMKLPEDGSVDNMQLNEFNEINKEKLKEIEQFLQILDDWVDEKLTFSEHRSRMSWWFSHFIRITL